MHIGNCVSVLLTAASANDFDSNVATTFQVALESESLRDLISACEDTMNALVLKRRESGASVLEHKCKLLQGSWMETKSDKKPASDADGEKLNVELRRDRLIKI